MFAPRPVPSEATPIPADLPQSASIRVAMAQVFARKPEGPVDEDGKLLALARERFRRCVEAEATWRTKAREELQFVDALEHWDPQMKAERKGRPCLVFDRIGPSIDNVVNHSRQNPPEPRIAPVGSGADKETAEVLQGLIRNIEHDSSADVAYMTGFEHAVKVGRGWWRVAFEWESEDGFEQKIVIKRVANLFSVYPDPAAVEHDYSDMRHAFVTEDLDVDVYRDLYPDSSIASLSTFESIEDPIKSDWFVNGAVRVAEYWWVETSYYTLAQLADGRKMPLDQVPEGANILNQRRVEKRQVKGIKLNGMEVLERWDWPGKWIPLIPVLGRETIEKGKRNLRGMIRPAMDANLSYDYMRSKQSEAIGLAPIAPWIAAEGQIEGHEETWKNANRIATSVLPYKVLDVNGTVVPPPQRNTAEPAIQAITIAVAHADNDIKATLSTYDASLGERGPQESGKAILARQTQDDNAHYHFSDNLGRSMRHTGRVIVDLTRYVYNEARLITIYDPDGAIRDVAINQPTKGKDGAQRIFRLNESMGRYDVTIGSGPSFPARRQQGATALMELTRTMPRPMERAVDLVIKALDIPDGDQLADRLRPPDVQEARDGEVPIPPEVQAQMAQQQQVIQAMTEELKQLTEVIQSKANDHAHEERMKAMEQQVKLIIANQQTGSAEATALMQQEFAAVKHELEIMRAQQAAEQQAQAPQPAQDAQAAQPEAPAAPAPDALAVPPNNAPVEPAA